MQRPERFTRTRERLERVLAVLLVVTWAGYGLIMLLGQ